MPAWAVRTALRWMMTDGEYQRRFSLLVSRQIDPAAWAPPRVLLGALARGAAADERRLVERFPSPSRV